ncbi:MAG: tetratricopeptide repeat protein [Candidatus Magasanikbacteria bacterium]
MSPEYDEGPSPGELEGGDGGEDDEEYERDNRGNYDESQIPKIISKKKLDAIPTEVIEGTLGRAHHYIQKAEQLWNQGKIDSAIEHLTEAIKYNKQQIEDDKKRSEDYRPYRLRALAKLDKGDFEGALEDINKAMKVLGEDPYEEKDSLYSDRGRIKTEKGDFDEAIEDFNEAIETGLDIKNNKFLVNRGEAKLKKGNLEGATEDFNKVIRKGADYRDKQVADAFYMLGKIKLKERDFEKANKYFFESIIAADGNPNPWAYWQRGKALEKLGKKEEAMRQYEEAANFDSAFKAQLEQVKKNNSERPSKLGAEKAPYLKGVEAMRNDRTEEAIELLSDAIDKNPDHVRAYISRGSERLYSKEPEDLKDAIEDFNKAEDLGSEDATLYENRGTAKRKLGDNEGALKDYNKAMDQDPLLTTYLNRAICRAELGEAEAAIKDLNAVLEDQPRNYKAYIIRGVAKEKKGDYEDAIEDFNRVIKLLEPSKDSSILAKTYWNRGVAKDNLGSEQNALEDFKKAVDLDPKYKNQLEGYQKETS